MRFTGWICRTWIETALNGWRSEFARFETEDEARSFGQWHNQNIRDDELAREYELYKFWEEEDEK